MSKHSSDIPTALALIRTYDKISIWCKDFNSYLQSTPDQAITILSQFERVEYNAVDNFSHIYFSKLIRATKHTEQKLTIDETILYHVQRSHPYPLLHGKLLEKCWRLGNANDIKDAVIRLEESGQVIRTLDGIATIYTLPV